MDRPASSKPIRIALLAVAGLSVMLLAAFLLRFHLALGYCWSCGW
jgi:hypothetical protein